MVCCDVFLFFSSMVQDFLVNILGSTWWLSVHLPPKVCYEHGQHIRYDKCCV